MLRDPSGKNGWIFEPTFGLIYFGRPIGMEASLFSGRDLIAEFKWLHELDSRKRIEGYTLFLKVLMTF